MKKLVANKLANKKDMNLHDLLITKLSILLDIENQLVKALPKLAKAATDKELSNGFKSHLNETKTHAKRLGSIFKILGAKPKTSIKSAGIRGIVEDSAWVIENIHPSKALDANLIASASYAEHYEIAGYRAAKGWADEMGYDEVVELLHKNLLEEIAAGEKLAALAVRKINSRADVE